MRQICHAIPAAFAIALSALLLLLPVSVEAKAIWSSTPANGGYLIREGFPVGNGRLGAIAFGQPGQEKISLNIDSLWSGGPFEVQGYTGGNPRSDKSLNLPSIRSRIFQNGVGDVNDLLGPNNYYGTYRVLANLTIAISGISQYANYNRSLDMNTGVHTTSFLANDNQTYTSAVYCSNPAQVCVYRLTASGRLPNVAISLENRLVQSNLYNTTCGASQVRLAGYTQSGPPRGMEYDVLARVSTGPLGMPASSCSTSEKGTLVITGSAYGKEMALNSFSVVVGAGTDYDQTKGNSANRYSFRGAKPGPTIEKTTAQASTKLEAKILLGHQQDYQGLMNTFALDLRDPWKGSQYPSETLEFFQLLDRYRYSAGVSANPKQKRQAKNLYTREAKTMQDTNPIGSGSGEQRSRYCWTDKCKRDQNLLIPPQIPESHQKWLPVSSATIPGHPFPTSLPAGFDFKRPVPWSTDGVATATVEGEQRVQTVSLTKSTEAAATNAPELPPLSEFSANVRSRLDTGTPKTAPTANDGDPYVEMLLFDFARHLFICSSREDSLPPNLQGIWTDQIESAWSGDYHANINLQMNHWFANQVGLGSLQNALFKYMHDTWVPRGQETARALYNGPGWVVHDEMNIFGHTAMKNDAKWANYPVAAAWMMQYVFDHYDYTRDLRFMRETGYLMMREVSQFWLSQLQPDQYTQDDTLVVNPCNSPERGPTTFGCTHYQQLIHQHFQNTLSVAQAVNDQDLQFTTSVNVFMHNMDKGIHFTKWGGLKEFKLPDAMGHDLQGERHRHISHLVGWFPGYSISAYASGYRNETLQRAVATSLRSRGNGNSPDGNTGWGKVWRAAAWARLNDTEQADWHLRFAIYTNIGPNGLSIYDGRYGPFQIDANFGLAGAMLSMFVVDLPQPPGMKSKRAVVLGPAIPARWGPGKIKGLRIRGGTTLDMEWTNTGSVGRVSIMKKGEGCLFYGRDGRKIGEI